MSVRCKLLKDYAGYKAGQEWSMHPNFVDRLKAEGIIEVIDRNVSRWNVSNYQEEE